MNINKEGYGVIGCAAAVILLVMGAYALADYMFGWSEWLFWTVETLLLLTIGFVISFFREPKRICITEEGTVFAPADGKVVVIEDVVEKEFFGDKRLQISVFMSLSNVHINWFPVSGKVVYKQYHPGEFLVASHPKSSDENEHISVAIDTGKCTVMYRQIAGLIARRIVSYVKSEGQQVKQNEQCGFIKFGSRVDVFLPVGSEVLIGLNQKVTGSQTPIARLK